MAHKDDSIVIDIALHTELKAAAAHHPAAQIATSPLAKALASDTAADGHIVNSALTAYLTAVEGGPLAGMSEPSHQALLTKISAAFPGR